MTETPGTSRPPASPRPSMRELRRAALGQDALLFCLAFTVGAAVYAVGRAVAEASSDAGAEDYWAIGLSDGLLLSGLVAGELFLLWNNGYRQGVRGHSIGKHRCGLLVVDVDSEATTGAARGLLRGLVTAVLLDLSVAAIPIGLPTVLREATPQSWHIGAATYLALAVLVVPLFLPTQRGLADRLLRTEVLRAHGADATTRPERQRALVVLGVLGVLGVAAVAATYVSYYWPLLFQLPNVT